MARGASQQGLPRQIHTPARLHLEGRHTRPVCLEFDRAGTGRHNLCHSGEMAQCEPCTNPQLYAPCTWHGIGRCWRLKRATYG